MLTGPRMLARDIEVMCAHRSRGRNPQALRERAFRSGRRAAVEFRDFRAGRGGDGEQLGVPGRVSPSRFWKSVKFGT
jgi:hypothetical protein